MTRAVDFSPFNQTPPELGNQFEDDRVFRSILRRLLPAEVLEAIRGELRELGELAGGSLFRQQLEERLLEPELVQWSPWGERIDRIDVTPLWKRAEKLAAELGVVAAGYETRFGAAARIHQFGLVHLFAPSTDVYGCPLAMTDGAAKTLLTSKNQALIDRAVPHLTTRDPSRFWTSGQWMTESTGGSDVGKSETIAVHDRDDQYRLFGRKWFTSATTSQMTLTLARPEGNGPGGRGLALFYLETRDEEGRLRNIEVNRLKDKLGTRKVPTAELMLRGVPATAVIGTTDGIRNIAPMLNITRTWNAVTAASSMRRGIALARDYARRREAFGAPLAQKPLHVETLAGLQAEYEAAMCLVFEVVAIIGRLEHGEGAPDDDALLRVLTPLTKLVTGKQVVAVISEVLEAFGGAGYVEDTGLPMLMRDAQVLPIWEGTTNVLSLEVIKSLSREPETAARFLAFFDRTTAGIEDPALRELAARARDAIVRAFAWLKFSATEQPLHTECGARHFSLTLGRSLELGLLAAHADFSRRVEGDRRARAAAHRFALERFDFIRDMDLDESRSIAMDDALA
jgi:acyl-CoA dehydrogenase